MRSNIEMIRGEGFRLINGRIPAQVRRELMLGVQDRVGIFYQAIINVIKIIFNTRTKQ